MTGPLALPQTLQLKLSSTAANIMPNNTNIITINFVQIPASNVLNNIKTELGIDTAITKKINVSEITDRFGITRVELFMENAKNKLANAQKEIRRAMENTKNIEEKTTLSEKKYYIGYDTFGRKTYLNIPDEDGNAVFHINPDKYYYQRITFNTKDNSIQIEEDAVHEHGVYDKTRFETDLTFIPDEKGNYHTVSGTEKDLGGFDGLEIK